MITKEQLDKWYEDGKKMKVQEGVNFFGGDGGIIASFMEGVELLKKKAKEETATCPECNLEVPVADITSVGCCVDCYADIVEDHLHRHGEKFSAINQ